MTASLAGALAGRQAFDQRLGAMRAKLHRYCARMTGSVIDGEDVVQEALAKAIEAFPRLGPVEHVDGWLFRIAHNQALDFLRHRARQQAVSSDHDPDLVADSAATPEDRPAPAASLRAFMGLPPAQRGCVILMDVLGYSLQEIGAVMQASLPAVKANLHRGRARLRAIARELDSLPPPPLDDAERARLAAYVERFNAGDFDALRDLLADEVRLDLVGRPRLNGRAEVGRYYDNHQRIRGWRLAVGWLDRRPALIAHDVRQPAGSPTHAVLLTWAGGRIVGIRDFLHAPYGIEGAEIVLLA